MKKKVTIKSVSKTMRNDEMLSPEELRFVERFLKHMSKQYKKIKKLKGN